MDRASVLFVHEGQHFRKGRNQSGNHGFRHRLFRRRTLPIGGNGRQVRIHGKIFDQKILRPEWREEITKLVADTGRQVIAGQIHGSPSKPVPGAEIPIVGIRQCKRGA